MEMDRRNGALTSYQKKIQKMTQEEREEFNQRNRERVRRRRALDKLEASDRAQDGHGPRRRKLENCAPSRWQKRLEKMTPEEREAVLRKARDRARMYRAQETPEIRKQRRTEMARRRREAYSQLTPRQLCQRRERDAERHREAYSQLTLEETRRLRQRGKDREVQQSRQAAATPEQQQTDEEGESSEEELDGGEVGKTEPVMESEPRVEMQTETQNKVSDEPVFFASTNSIKTYSTRKRDRTIQPVEEPETNPGEVKNPGGKLTCVFPDCNRTFRNLDSLVVHTRKHNNERPYCCDLESCGRSYYCRRDLQRHVSTHTAETRYECPVIGCGERFVERRQLWAHKPTHYKDTDLEEISPQLMCETQIKTEPEEYDEHAESDTEKETKFLGDMYNFLDPRQNYSQASAEDWAETVTVKVEPSDVNPDLDSESNDSGPNSTVPTGTGSRPFQCEFEDCGWRFPSNWELRRHGLTHNKEKPFACDHPGCELRFLRKRQLEVHRREHTGEDVLECNFENCGQKFMHVSVFERHMRAHTGDRPFACGCGKRFFEYYLLRQHVEDVHGEKLALGGDGPQPVGETSIGIENEERDSGGDEDPKPCSVLRPQIKVEPEDYEEAVSDTNISEDGNGEKVYKEENQRRIEDHVKVEPESMLGTNVGINVAGCNLTYSLVRKNGLLVHTYSLPKPFQCPFEDCTARFINEKFLNRHIREHGKVKRRRRGPNRPRIDLAVKEASNTEVKEKVAEKSHPEKVEVPVYAAAKMFPCEYENCGRVFSRKCALERHAVSHADCEVFQCEAEGCGLRFTDRHELLRHGVAHTVKKQLYVCKFKGCKQKFSQRHRLRVHHMKHTGNKPFQCPAEGCGRSFYENFMLRKHVATHNKRFACSYAGCSKSYNQKCTYQKHLATHEAQNLPPDLA